MENLQLTKNTIEAVLFAAGYPLSFAKLAEVCETEISEIKNIVSDMVYDYEGHGIQLVIYKDSCQLCSRKDYQSAVKTALGIKGNTNLSNSSLEVLSIIAYNQPTTKAFVEQVRGVDCSYAVTNLLSKKLIEIKGRLDAPGKPMLYATTDDFLRCFGLSSISDLPQKEMAKAELKANTVEDGANQEEKTEQVKFFEQENEATE